MGCHAGIVAAIFDSAVVVAGKAAHVGVANDVAIDLEVFNHAALFEDTYESGVFGALVGGYGAVGGKFASVEIDVCNLVSSTIKNTGKAIGARVVDADAYEARVFLKVNVVGDFEVSALKRQEIVCGGRSKRDEVGFILDEIRLGLGAFALKQRGWGELYGDLLLESANRSDQSVGRYGAGEVNVALGVDVHAHTLGSCHTVAKHLPLNGIEHVSSEVGADLVNVLVVVGKLDRSGCHIGGRSRLQTLDARIASGFKHPNRVGEALKSGCCEL